MLVVQKAVYDTYIQYLYWVPEKQDTLYTYGPGVEMTVDKPKIEYIYAQDYPFGDGWQKLANQVDIENIYGNINNMGSDSSNTGPLFNLIYFPPIFRNLHATSEYKRLSMKLSAIAWLDTLYRYNSIPYASTDLSDDAFRIISKLDMLGAFNKPKQVSKNDRSESDYDNFIICAETNKIQNIQEYEYYWCHFRLKEEAVKWRNSYKVLDDIGYNLWEQMELE